MVQVNELLLVLNKELFDDRIEQLVLIDISMNNVFISIDENKDKVIDQLLDRSELGYNVDELVIFFLNNENFNNVEGKCVIVELDENIVVDGNVVNNKNLVD